MNYFLALYKKMGFWVYVALFTSLAILLSELLIIIQSYYLTGNFFDRNLLIVGFFTPAVDAFIVFFLSGLLVEYLVKERDKLHSLQEELHTVLKHSQKSELLVAKERDKAQRYLDLSGSMIIALNKEGIVTMINQKGCELLEGSEADIIGKNWFENFLVVDDVAMVKGFFLR